HHLVFLSILLVPYHATLTPLSSTSTGNQNGSVHATPIATTPPPAKSTPPPAVTPTAAPTQAPPTPTPTATPSPTATATPTPAVTTNAANGALINSSITFRDHTSFSASLASAQDRCQAVLHQCLTLSPATHIW